MESLFAIIIRTEYLPPSLLPFSLVTLLTLTIQISNKTIKKPTFSTQITSEPSTTTIATCSRVHV